MRWNCCAPVPSWFCAGDYNICHEAIDIHDPVRNATNSGFLPEEREWMTRFLNEGFIDASACCTPTAGNTPGGATASMPKNNAGWRIDYFIVSERLKDKIRNADIWSEVLGSDHCPVVLDLDV